MSYGAGRLIATRAAPNIPLKFDGVTGRARVGDSTISAFFMRPDQESAAKFDGEDEKTTFWGVYGESILPGVPAVKVNAYYLGIRREESWYASGAATGHAQVFGLRVFGVAAGWDYDAEGIGEAGTFGAQDIRAWALSQDSGYTFSNLPWTPRLGLKTDVASGDRHPHDGTLGTFDPLFFKSGYFNGASLYRPSNLVDVHPTLQVKPCETVVLGLGSDVLWRYTVNDGIYSPPGALVLKPNGHGSHYLGTTAEATAEWRINRHLTVDLEYVYFFGGGYVRAAKGSDVTFFSATTSFLF